MAKSDLLAMTQSDLVAMAQSDRVAIAKCDTLAMTQRDLVDMVQSNLVDLAQSNRMAMAQNDRVAMAQSDRVAMAKVTVWLWPKAMVVSQTLWSDTLLAVAGSPRGCRKPDRRRSPQCSGEPMSKDLQKQRKVNVKL